MSNGAKRIHFSCFFFSRAYKKKNLFSLESTNGRNEKRRKETRSLVSIFNEREHTYKFILVLSYICLCVCVCLPGGVVSTTRWLQLDMNKPVNHMFSLLLLMIFIYSEYNLQYVRVTFVPKLIVCVCLYFIGEDEEKKTYNGTKERRKMSRVWTIIITLIIRSHTQLILELLPLHNHNIDISEQQT